MAKPTIKSLTESNAALLAENADLLARLTHAESRLTKAQKTFMEQKSEITRLRKMVPGAQRNEDRVYDSPIPCTVKDCDFQILTRFQGIKHHNDHRAAKAVVAVVEDAFAADLG